MADAHPKNAPGPFYVVDGCCLFCGVWESVAPDLFAFDDHHCYVKHQPRNPAEFDRMLVAVWAAEASCIRYRGHDPTIFERLGALGRPELCDSPPPEGIPVVLRNHVAFESADHHPRALGDAVEDFRSFFVRSDRHKFRGPAHSRPERATWFEFAWYEEKYHRVCVSSVDRDVRRILMSHSPSAVPGSRGVSNQLSDWLTQSSRYGNQRWYTAEQWAQESPGSPTPW